MAVRQNHGMLPEIDAKSQLSRISNRRGWPQKTGADKQQVAP